MDKKLLAKYISAAVKYVIKSHHQSYREVSQQLNVSYGYFRQLMSGNRTLTIYDLYSISRLENISVSKLFPPTKSDLNSFKRFQRITGQKSRGEFTKFLNSIE